MAAGGAGAARAPRRRPGGAAAAGRAVGTPSVTGRASPKGRQSFTFAAFERHIALAALSWARSTQPHEFDKLSKGQHEDEASWSTRSLSLQAQRMSVALQLAAAEEIATELRLTAASEDAAVA